MLIRSHNTCIFKMYRINDTINIIYYPYWFSILMKNYINYFHPLIVLLWIWTMNMKMQRLLQIVIWMNCMSSISVSAVNNKTEKRLLSKILHIKKLYKKNCIYVIWCNKRCYYSQPGLSCLLENGNETLSLLVITFKQIHFKKHI